MAQKAENAMDKKTILFTPTEKKFFQLIKLAVGGIPDVTIEIAADEWVTLYDMSRKQAMTAIVLDGVEKLPSGQKPPMEVLMPWISLVQQTEAHNRNLNRLAAKVCAKFADEGMDSVVLKGQGNALLYPNPLHRTPGDIDLWVNATRPDLVAYARRFCPGVEVVYHHVDFPVLKETEIELHSTPSWMNEWAMNRRLQHYFGEWKPESLRHRVQLPEGAGVIAVPTPEMNRIYLLVHIYRHLFDEGIGLRQLTDYYFALCQPCSPEERAATVKVLKRLRLKRFAEAVMYVMQEVFGLPDAHLLLPPSPGRGNRLLGEIMLAGNFGQHDTRIHHHAGETPLARFRRKVSRNFAFLADYPGEVLWSPLFKLWHFTWRARHGYFAQGKTH